MENYDGSSRHGKALSTTKEAGRDRRSRTRKTRKRMEHERSPVARALPHFFWPPARLPKQAGYHAPACCPA